MHDPCSEVPWRLSLSPPLRPCSNSVRLRPVRGLLFDLGDVLYDATVWRRWLLQLLSRLGLHTHYRAFFHLGDHEYLADVYRGRRDFNEAFRVFLLAAGLSHGQIDEVQAACKARRTECETTARALPGVKTTLRRLHASGIALGVTCNCEHPAADTIRQIERLGLGDLFTTVVTSVDVGQVLPEPTGYRAALAALKLEAAQTAFVGHDGEELAGAARLGMPTIAFNFDPDAQADVYLARFEELCELLATPSPYAAAG